MRQEPPPHFHPPRNWGWLRDTPDPPDPPVLAEHQRLSEAWEAADKAAQAVAYTAGATPDDMQRAQWAATEARGEVIGYEVRQASAVLAALRWAVTHHPGSVADLLVAALRGVAADDRRRRELAVALVAVLTPDLRPVADRLDNLASRLAKLERVVGWAADQLRRKGVSR